MVTPAQRREAVGWLRKEKSTSERLACRIVRQPRATQRRRRCGRLNGAPEAEARLLELAQAHAYNDALDAGAIVLKAGDRKPSSSGGESGSGLDYDKMLSADDEGTMGWLTIPKIHVNLPIYHGTSDEVLEKGVGHL